MSISYYLCWFVLPILLTGCASAYLTGLICRFATWRHWKVRLYFGIIGAVVAGTLTGLFAWLGLHGVGKIDEREFFQSMFLRVIPFALPAALVVAWRYKVLWQRTLKQIVE